MTATEKPFTAWYEYVSEFDGAECEDVEVFTTEEQALAWFNKHSCGRYGEITNNGKLIFSGRV